MGSIPLPALDIRPPQQQPGPLQNYIALSNLLGARQQREIQQQQLIGAQQANQLQALQLKDANTLRQLSLQFVTRDKDGTPTGFDSEGFVNAAAQANVSPQTLMGLQNSMVDFKSKMLRLTKDQLATQDALNKGYYERLEGLRALTDPTQRQFAYQGALNWAKQNGADTSGFPQQAPDNDALSAYETNLGMHAQAIQDAKDVQSTATSKAQQDEAEANTAKVQKETSQLGQITPAIEYEQAQENYRAALARQATFANQLQKDGMDKLNQMWADPQHGYAQFIAQANSTKNAVAQSQNGNQLASSLAPLMTALGVTSFAGVHRINQTDVNQAGANVGSVYRRINSLLDKASQGRLNPDTAKEMNSLIDDLVSAKHSAVLNATQMVSRNYGLNPDTTMVMNPDGGMDTLTNALKTNRQAAPNLPPVQSGFTRIKASDGSLHDVPTGNLAEAKKIDPGLRVVQ